MLHQGAQQQNRHGLQGRCGRFSTKLCASTKTHEAAVLRTFLQAVPSPPRPICLARVVEVSPGCKGLVAAQQLQPSTAALMLPPYNTLSVPVTDQQAAGAASAADNVYQWECSWLQAFERVHGPLPSVLVKYLGQQGDAHLGAGTGRCTGLTHKLSTAAPVSAHTCTCTCGPQIWYVVQHAVSVSGCIRTACVGGQRKPR